MTPDEAGNIQTGPAVSRATQDNLAAVLETLTLAFGSDPVVRWVYPEDAPFRHYFPRFAKAFGGKSLALGTAFVSEEITGAALWLPAETEPDEDAMMAIMEEAVSAERLEEIGTYFEMLEPYHPGEPFWYLALLGVDPARQGEGVGSAILGESLRLVDAQHRPAYLEATCERNAALYRRHGFEQMGLVEQPGCPPLIPMVRPAR